MVWYGRLKEDRKLEVAGDWKRQEDSDDKVSVFAWPAMLADGYHLPLVEPGWFGRVLLCVSSKLTKAQSVQNHGYHGRFVVVFDLCIIFPVRFSLGKSSNEKSMHISSTTNKQRHEKMDVACSFSISPAFICPVSFLQGSAISSLETCAMSDIAGRMGQKKIQNHATSTTAIL